MGKAKPRVNLHGKKGCGKCQSAKEKLDRFVAKGTIESYQHHNLEEPKPDWRENDSAEAMSHYQLHGDLPVIAIDGKAHKYSEAMKEIKQLSKNGGNNGKAE